MYGVSAFDIFGTKETNTTKMLNQSGRGELNAFTRQRPKLGCAPESAAFCQDTGQLRSGIALDGQRETQNPLFRARRRAA